MSIVTLPGGRTAELRDKVTVRGRQAVQVESAEVTRLMRERMPDVKPEDYTEVDVLMGGRELMEAFHRLNRAVLVALLKSWSLPDALPTVDDPGEVEADVYDALLEVVGPRVGEIAGFASVDTEKDPRTPPVPSSVSNGGGLAPTTHTTSLPTGSSVSATSTTSAPVSP